VYLLIQLLISLKINSTILYKTWILYTNSWTGASLAIEAQWISCYFHKRRKETGLLATGLIWVISSHYTTLQVHISNCSAISPVEIRPVTSGSPWIWKQLAPVTRLTTHHTTLCHNAPHHDANVQDFWNCHNKIMSCTMTTGERSWMFYWSAVGKDWFLCVHCTTIFRNAIPIKKLSETAHKLQVRPNRCLILQTKCQIKVVTETRERSLCLLMSRITKWTI